MKMEIKAQRQEPACFSDAYIWEDLDGKNFLYLKTGDGWVYITPTGRVGNSGFNDLEMFASSRTRRVPPGTVVTLSF